MTPNHNIWNYLYFTYYLCTRGDFHALFCAFIFKCATFFSPQKTSLRFDNVIWSNRNISLFYGKFKTYLKKFFIDNIDILNLLDRIHCYNILNINNKTGVLLTAFCNLKIMKTIWILRKLKTWTRMFVYHRLDVRRISTFSFNCFARNL